MISTQIIVHSFYNETPGLRTFFQIILPRDTKRIVGVDHRYITRPVIQELMPVLAEPIPAPFQVQRNWVVGRLSLFVPGCENIFYQGEIFEDNNIHTGEAATFSGWAPALWTHSRKQSSTALSVKTGSQLIEGYYKDITSGFTFNPYYLYIYLWIEKSKP